MNESLHFAEHTLQEAALTIMAAVYITRILWLLHFKKGRERQAPTGLSNTSKKRGIVYSWGIIGMPWEMESSRKHIILYSQFVIFHLGVALSIAMSFLIPYSPSSFGSLWFGILLQVVFGAACIVGVTRIIRRLSQPVMRAISTPDDYFSVFLLTIWLLFSFLAVPGGLVSTEWVLLAYFWLTAFFLIYVPFSKISHYLYYPFTRYYLGKTMGYRGGFPLRGTRKV